MSFFPEGSRVRFASFLMRDRAHNCWEEVSHSMGADAMKAMTWHDFVTRFRVEFALAIEV